MEIREKHFRLLVYLCTCVLVTLLLSGCEWYRNMLKDLEHKNPFDVNSPEYIDFVPGELLISFKIGATESEAIQLVQSYGCTVIKSYPIVGYLLVKIPDNKTEKEMIEIFKKDPRVSYVGVNRIGSQEPQ